MDQLPTWLAAAVTAAGMAAVYNDADWDRLPAAQAVAGPDSSESTAPSFPH